MFTSVVSLLVCADIYAQGNAKNRRGGLPVGDGAERGLWLCQHDRGDDAAGRYNRCTDGLRGLRHFFSFSGMAPAIATKFGESAVHMILPMQLMAGMGRSISPRRRDHHCGQQSR